MVNSDSPNKHWYALEVKPPLAGWLSETLSNKGIEVFYPTYVSQRIWSDRTGEVKVPLFRGYLFARFDANNRMPVLVTPGVKRILGCGKQPLAVEDEELTCIKTAIDSALPVEPCPYLPVGTRVLIHRGPLSGRRGILVRHRAHCKVVLSIELIQRSVAVEIDESCIKLIAPPTFWSPAAPRGLTAS